MNILDLKEKNRILLNNKLGHNKSISNGDRWDFQEMIRMKYPEQWETTYKNKWPVRIIYYDHNNNVSIHEFYLHRHTNMQSIMNIFVKYLDCQKLALNNCFGNDIAEIIMSYLPNTLTKNDIVNNSIYVHARFWDWEHNIRVQHSIFVPPEYSINKLHGKLNLWGGPSLSRYTILRIRAIKQPSIKHINIPANW
jgi:hypothetical protein